MGQQGINFGVGRGERVDPDAFRHEALIYTDDEGFLAGTVPFLRNGLEAGEPALVAVGPDRTRLLRGQLGADAAEVHFAEMQTLGANPARIIPFWRDFVDEHAGRPVRGIGEPIWPGRHAHEIEECQRHEHLLNVAFEPAPAWSLLCPYDGRNLDDEVLRAVAASHLAVGHDGAQGSSDDYTAGGHQFHGELTAHPAGAVIFEFDIEGLAQVRRLVEGAAERAGLRPPYGADVVFAAGELAANSVVHGGGSGTLRIWREAERLVVEVEDEGRITEPLVGRLKPRPEQAGGRGLWLANQLCDLVQIRSGLSGTRVRLHMSTV
jgi:anti-sigma regulatory factor (Ser/Thr protein kinase)